MTVGIIGGIGPESTIEYYRKIVSSYLEHNSNRNYPQVIINSINMTKMLDLVGKGELEAVTDYLATEVRRLEASGADFGVIASNTPHIVFDEVRKQSQLPLISIVEAACQKILKAELTKVALLGTEFTMKGEFYDKVLSENGIEVITPDDADQHFVHQKYMGELVKGIVLDSTRVGLIDVIEKMKQVHRVQGLILGGTELSLILQPNDVPDIHIFDTTEIHVESIVNRLV